MQPLESGLGWKEELEWAIKALALLLRDEKTISAYEVHTNRLVPILLHCLLGPGKRGGAGGVPSKERAEGFRRIFAESAQEAPTDLDSRSVQNFSGFRQIFYWSATTDSDLFYNRKSPRDTNFC